MSSGSCCAATAFSTPGRGSRWSTGPAAPRRGCSTRGVYSLTERGSRLAATALLSRLSAFASTQLATFGTTGIPLMTACVMRGGGRYTGLCIREEPKGHAGGRQIEGPADPTRSVVLVDDSLSSGRSFLRGAKILEQQGFQVEGTVCLVHFPHRGGRERAEALGYHVETLFDIWDDLGMARPVHVPGFERAATGEVRSAAAVPDGLSPVVAARLVAEHLLRAGELLEPPRRFDAEYDASGGTWVSFRERDGQVRVARDGFWHFDDTAANPCRDLVLATAKTVRSGGLRLEQIDRLKIAVTHFGRLERTAPKGLDFSRYGIVIRSLAWPVKVGGALPNTQVFTSEREQLDLAIRNAQLSELEPYELFRHEVRKQVEEGADWLPYGAPDGSRYDWTHASDLAETLTTRALAAAVAATRGEPVPLGAVPSTLIPVPVAGVGVTLYHGGVVGCSVSQRDDLDTALVAAAQAAVQDPRFADRRRDAGDQLVAAVSVLYDPEPLGLTTADRAARKVRLGRDSLSVTQGDRSAIFLESVGPQYDWTKQKLADQLLRKARATDAPAHWTTFRTASWLGGSPTVRHEFGFAGPPDDCDGSALRADLALLGEHLAANLTDSGIPRYAQTPVPGWTWEFGSAARVIHGLSGLHLAGGVLDRAEWQKIALAGLRTCLAAVQVDPATGLGRLRLPGQRNGPMGDCELLAAACVAGLRDEADATLTALAARVAAMLRADGSVHPDDGLVRSERDNDYLPNAAVLALAEFHRHTPDGLADRLEPQRAWQLRRFQRLHRWGQAGWLPQACAAVYRATGNRAHARTAFEVADWCLDWQVRANGAMLCDLSPDGPGFHTAFVAEGIADAWQLAADRGEQAIAARYAQSWWAAMAFARQLIIRPADAPCLTDPATQIGGVRGARTSGTVRVDFVSHLAIAIAKGLTTTAA